MTAPGIHRQSEIATLSDLIKNTRDRVGVFGISGPGGIGKTFLLNHVLETIAVEELGYLHLSASGSAVQARGDFFSVIEGQLFRRTLSPPADSSKDYFPRIRELAEMHRGLVESTEAELAARGAPVDVKRAAIALLRAGHVLNEVIPKTKEVLDVASHEISEKRVIESLDAAWTLLHSAKVLRETTLLPGPLRDLFGVTRKNRLRRDLYALASSELRGDLSAALVGYERRDRQRLTHGKIPGLDRLLIVLDDYEVLGPVLEEFLIGSFVPALAGAPFSTVIIVLGRDDLEVTHPGWAQHCKRYLRGQIRLSPFSRDTAFEMLANAGVPEARRASMVEASQGYPFLLDLLIEEDRGEGDSALFLRRFFDRTTRWMTALERDWFLRVCYLDRVDEDTLASMFDPAEVGAVQNWFEREPSVRDPSSRFFEVRPLIRDKVLQYQAVRAPARHRELLAKVAAAST